MDVCLKPAVCCLSSSRVPAEPPAQRRTYRPRLLSEQVVLTPSSSAASSTVPGYPPRRHHHSGARHQRPTGRLPPTIHKRGVIPLNRSDNKPGPFHLYSAATTIYEPPALPVSSPGPITASIVTRDVTGPPPPPRPQPASSAPPGAPGGGR